MVIKRLVKLLLLSYFFKLAFSQLWNESFSSMVNCQSIYFFIFLWPRYMQNVQSTKMFIHSIFYHFQEKTSPVSKSGTNSPVLSRTQQNILDATSKTAQTLGGLPQATLDLSGPNSRVLELSTLVWNYTWTNWNDNTQIFMSFLWKQGNKTDELSPTLKLLHLKAGECSVMIISKLFWLPIAKCIEIFLIAITYISSLKQFMTRYVQLCMYT